MRGYAWNPTENRACFSMGGGHSTTTTTQELSPEQRALIAPVIPIAKEFLAHPPQMYPGSGIVDFNPLQRQAQGMTMNAAYSMMPTLNQMPGRLNALLGQYGSYAGGLDKLSQQENFLTSGAVLNPSSNPALQASIEAATRPTLQAFQRSILPGIQGEAVGAGGFGGTRQGIASGIAASDTSRQIGDIAAQMANANYQAGLQAMTQGFGAANQTQQARLAGLQGQQGVLSAMPGLFQSMTLPGQILGAVGGQQQAMEQAKLSEKVQRYVNEQMIPFSAAQDVAAMAFGMPGGTVRSESTQPGNPMAGAQLGMSALSILPALIGKSERSEKRDIRYYKTLPDGLNVYSFRYLDEEKERIGLMADEVEKVYPEAVREIDGIRHVNYLAVPSWMGAI